MASKQFIGEGRPETWRVAEPPPAPGRDQEAPAGGTPPSSILKASESAIGETQAMVQRIERFGEPAPHGIFWTKA